MKKFLKAEIIIPVTIIIFSITGLYSAFILTTEKIELLKNADRVLPCTVNIIINCASVMKSPQAEVFGFPNPILGLIGYSTMLTFGVSLLFSKTRAKVYILLTTLGSFLSVIFTYWLLSQSVYIIGSLCPYCLLSGISATNIFFALIYLNLKDGNFRPFIRIDIDKRKSAFISIFGSSIVLWYLLIITLIYLEFGDNLLS